MERVKSKIKEIDKYNIGTLSLSTDSKLLNQYGMKSITAFCLSCIIAHAMV